MRTAQGTVLLNVIAFMVIGFFILTGYFLRSYYQTQKTHQEQKRSRIKYALEGDLQRAISLVRSSCRKDITDSGSFPNQSMWLTPGIKIEVKEFSNWEGYVIMGTEELNEVNSADPLISNDYPVSLKVSSTEDELEMEYIIPAPEGSESFTLYAREDLIVDSNPNWYPYYSDSEYWRWYDYYYGVTNDVRIENSIVKYGGSLDGNMTYKFGTGAAPNHMIFELPFYLDGTREEFALWLQSLVDEGAVMEKGSFYSNLTVLELRSYNPDLRPWARPGQLNVIAVFGDLTIAAEHSYLYQSVDNDMLFIVTGDVLMKGEYWFGETGRLGVVSYGNIYIDADKEMIGGNMFLVCNSLFLVSNYTGNISIRGKVLSGADLVLYGDDYDPVYYENTGTDFSQPKQLRGTCLQDKADIFDVPRPVSIDLDLPSDSIGCKAVWR